ncbi:TRAF3-interacting JNK-activating modulator isoform X2 [Hyperolius riggenbachi]|uniref:TRAF3-interacting JNK-activating modulator isoform X2 n=1 Tax=Hyperolius riggenbachi TaxID=752182 RepID=UPI0035A3BA59
MVTPNFHGTGCNLNQCLNEEYSKVLPWNMVMAGKSGKSKVSQKLNESFEDKHERRLEFHETLRSRYNITSCRQENPNWGAQQQKCSPREKEFFKRRHLWFNKSGGLRVRSRSRSKNCNRYSFTEQCSDASFQSKHQHSPRDIKDSWHESQSTNPCDCTIVKTDTVFTSHHFESLIPKMTENHVPKKSKGVQTVQEMPVICLKRNSSQQTDFAVCVLSGELQQLSEYLMEALHREKKLKRKLCVLQKLLSMLAQTSKISWKNFTKKNIQKMLLEMEENNQKYQEKAKKSLQKLTDDKIATESQLQNTQMSLAVSTDECNLWKEEYDKLKVDWIELSNKHCELKNELNVLQSKLQWVTNQDAQFEQLKNCLRNVQQERIELQVCNEQLQENCEMQNEHLSSLQGRLRNTEEQKLQMKIQIKALQNELATLEQRNFSSITKDTAILHVCEIPDRPLLSDQFQLTVKKLKSKEEERRCSCWMPVFMMIFAVAIAYLFSTEIEQFLR